MHSSVRGFVGEASVPVGGVTLTSADHVAAGHTLDNIHVSTTAWKILWASLSTNAVKNLINRHKRSTDVRQQLESRHAPETMSKTSMLLKKYEPYRIAPTSDPILDTAALSDIRAQLSVRKTAITDQMFCVRVLDFLLRECDYEVRPLSICADSDHPPLH